MGYHWDVNLEIECGSAEEAERLHSYLEQHNLEDDCVTFETNGFFIAGNTFTLMPMRIPFTSVMKHIQMILADVISMTSSLKLKILAKKQMFQLKI